MGRQYWLVKQEPSDYPWEKFVQEGGTAWTGVRNYQARHYLQAMQAGDKVFYYHSGAVRAVVGLACVTRAAYPDPTATKEGWVCVDLAPVKPLPRSVSLAQIKTDPVLHDLPLVRQSRLSVCPVTAAQARRLMELAR